MSQMSLMGTHTIQNKEDLSVLASRIVKEVKAGDVLLLSGELGAGKTTFTQVVGKALGVKEVITSPTYTLLGEYNTIHNPHISTLVHIDLYRAGETSQPSALSDAYTREIIENAETNKTVVVIEWAELIRFTIKNRMWRILIQSGNEEEKRLITIED